MIMIGKGGEMGMKAVNESSAYDNNATAYGIAEAIRGGVRLSIKALPMDR